MTRHNSAVCSLNLCTPAAFADGPVIRPVPGLVLTTALHANWLSGAIGAVNRLDMELLLSLTAAGPERLTNAFHMNAPADALTIEGHTDHPGSAEHNPLLSEQGAGAVRQAVVTRDAAPTTRHVAKGYGPTRPGETHETFEGRAHHRCVEPSRKCAEAH